jgi:hypothetical protein
MTTSPKPNNHKAFLRLISEGLTKIEAFAGVTVRPGFEARCADHEGLIIWRLSCLCSILERHEAERHKLSARMNRIFAQVEAGTSKSEKTKEAGHEKQSQALAEIKG